MLAKTILCLATILALSLASPQKTPSIPSDSAIAPECLSQCGERYHVLSEVSGAEHPCFKGCKFFALRASSHPASGEVVDLSEKDTFSGCNTDCQEAYKDEHERSQCNSGCSMGSSQPKLEQNGDEMQGRSLGGISFRIPLFSPFSKGFDDLSNSFVSLPRLNNIFWGNQGIDRMDEVEKSFEDMFKNVKEGISRRMEDVVPPMNSALANLNYNLKKAMEEMTHMKPPTFTIVDSEDDANNNNSAALSTSEPVSLGHFVSSQINDMMEKTKNIFGSDPFSSLFGNLFDSSTLPNRGNGKLVVIKSGPGYHQEKTYNLNADSDISQILKDDMMNEPNPLDDLADSNKDVEVFGPKIVENVDESNAREGSDMDIEVFGPITLPSDPNVNSDNDLDDSIFEVLGPLLRQSENERRPFNGHNLVLVDLCAQDRRQMTWSQWFACLHSRMGVPRWLMAATICSGIILSIWMCLVIPKSMSRNSKKSRKSIGVKELEATSNPHSAVVILDTNYPLDLPPSYDDVASTKVKPQPEKESAGAEALPAKSVAMPSSEQV